MKRWGLIGGFFLFTGLAHADYSGYSYQRTLTIDHTKVSTNTLTLANFPVLISTTAVFLSTVAANGGKLANAGGYDFIFSTMSDCSYLLNWDTETYTASTGKLEAWVRAPTVSSATDTTLYLCYGNSNITTYQGISSATWDSSYRAVWHMKGGIPQDSANKLAVGTAYSVTSGTGPIDGSGNFDGTNSWITEGSVAPIAYTGNTIEAWIYVNNSTTRIIAEHYVAAYGCTFFSAGGNLFYQYQSDSNNYVNCSVTAAIPTKAWVYVAAIMNGSSVQLFQNGETHNDAVGSKGTPLTFAYPTQEMSIGGRVGTGSYRWTGTLDEIRISDTARSKGWILTEYANQSAPGTFLLFGDETTPPVPTGNALFGNEF